MEPRTTTCPFCLNGCTSGVLFNGYRYEAHYPADGKVNRGRLCPRGNSASVVIDHRERLCRPLLDGRDVRWQQAEGLVRQWLAAVKPEELAIVYGRGRSPDEVRRLHGLARELRTPNLVCGHVEPENGFNYRLDGVADATLEQIEMAKVMLLVGDVFGTSPVAAFRMLDARYADRKNRLIVVDSLRTRQSGFAHQFIQVTPGTEPFALLALAALVDSKLVRAVDVDRMAALAGVERSGLEAAARTLALDLPAFVGTAMHFGRVYHPALQSLSAQLVARAAQCPFMGFREAALPAGTMKFSDLRRAIGAGRIRMVFWTGGLFPYSYAELMPELAKVEFLVATAIFAPNPPLRGLVLPLAAELERQSSGGSYWGPVERKPLAAPLSGTREFGGVLGWFGRAAEAPEPAAKPAAAADVVAAAEKAAGQVHLTDGTLLLGEKTAIGLRGFYDGEDELRLHPADAAILGLAGRDVVAVKSPAAEVEFRVRVTDAVQTGTAAAGVNVHRNRALFPLAEEDMTGEATVPPVRVSVTKTGRTARSGGESPSVWT